jgi:hypothetical protein
MAEGRYVPSLDRESDLRVQRRDSPRTNRKRLLVWVSVIAAVALATVSGVALAFQGPPTIYAGSPTSPGAAYTNSLTVPVYLHAEADPGKAVRGYRVGEGTIDAVNNASRYTPVDPAVEIFDGVETVTFTNLGEGTQDGLKTVSAQFYEAHPTNASGKAYSGVVTDRIILDRTLPTVSISLAEGQTLTESVVTIGGTADDPVNNGVSAGVASIEVAIQRSGDGSYWDGSAWSAGETWLPCAGTTSWSYEWTLEPAIQYGSPSYTVSARATDHAGNTAGASVAGITADNDVPVPVSAVGAVAEDKAYDGTTAASVLFESAELEGVSEGDDVYLVTSGYSAAFEDKDVGEDKAVAVSGLELAGDDAEKYSLAQPVLVATISAKSLTVTGALALDKEYDGTAAAEVDFSAVELLGLIGYDAVTLVTSAYEAGFVDNDAGDEKTVTVTGLALAGTDSANYSLQAQLELTAAITPRPVTVAAEDKSKLAGDDDPEFTYLLIDGSLVEDDLFIGELTREPGEESGEYPIEQGTLSLGSNYQLAFIPGMLTIEAPSTLPLTLLAGWNLVAGGPASDFLGATLFGFDGTAYFSTASSNMVAGQGYWVRQENGTTVSITTVTPPLAVLLDPGWNLIGNAGSTVVSLPAGMTAFIFDGTRYLSTSTLQPGQGAWVRASVAEEIILE